MVNDSLGISEMIYYILVIYCVEFGFEIKMTKRNMWNISIFLFFSFFFFLLVVKSVKYALFELLHLYHLPTYFSKK